MAESIYICRYELSLGPVTMASDGEFLIGLWFDGQKYDRLLLKGKSLKELDSEEAEQMSVFRLTKEWLHQYFDEKINPSFIPPLKLEGSAFRRLVWEILLTIPYGQTMTYGQIGKIVAERMGEKRMSAQAVGGAVGHNPISLIIPCHRVVGADGSLTGYAGGVEKKRYLLEMEQRNVDKLRSVSRLIKIE